MKILLIDTCGATGSVALVDTSLAPAAVARESLPDRTASERLIATIKELTVRTDISLATLGAVVIVHGPGSFTGVRVGLSAAKGLCEARNLPLVAISRLAVLAHLAGIRLNARVCALFDAGRGEFYRGDYIEGICLRETLQTRDELLASIHPSVIGAAASNSGQTSSTVIVTCESPVAQSLTELDPHLVREPSAEDALPLALLRIQSGAFDDPATLDANYLRRTDAEIFAKPRPAEAFK